MLLADRSGPKRPLVIAGLLVFALALTLIRFAPNVARDDIYDGDATHHVFWAYRFADPELFPNDFASEYFASDTVVPPGYRALYRGLASAIDAQLAAELVGAALFAISLLLAARLGSEIAGGVPIISAWTLMLVLAIAIEKLHLLPPMGLQRSFALPLTLWAILALMHGRLIQLGFVFLFAALFYPIICASIGTGSALILGLRLIDERRLPAGWVPLGVIGISALTIIATRDVPDGIGPMVSGAQALAMPEFGPNGRQKLFEDGVRGFLYYHRTGLGLPLKWFLLTLMGLGILAACRRLSLIPKEVWILSLAGTAIWAIARYNLFVLYLPARHASWLLPVLVASIAAALATTFLESRSVAARRTSVSVLAIAVVAYYGQVAAGEFAKPINHELEQAWSYLRTTPKDSLIAAHPLDADPIPLRTRRSVLVSRETSISFMLGYYEHVSERITASLEAAYATDWATIDRLADRWDVDLFLITDSALDANRYDEPFNDLVQKLHSGGRSDGFVLRDPPDERVLFRNDSVTIVRVGESASASR